jgi:hypothetical protein
MTRLDIANDPPSVFRHFPAGFAAQGCWCVVTGAQCALRIDIVIEGFSEGICGRPVQRRAIAPLSDARHS